MSMDRYTCRWPTAVLDDVDAIVEAGYYASRSEFFRDAAREKLQREGALGTSQGRPIQTGDLVLEADGGHQEVADE
jgi:metal-responsive CopG/Arc/MetJ family transcriptional regulator